MEDCRPLTSATSVAEQLQKLGTIRNFARPILCLSQNLITMLTGLTHTHSLLRYFILIALVVVIVNSLLGMMNKKPFGFWDNKFSLYLLIFTHMQLVVGIILYIINLNQNRLVQFNSTTMKNEGLRYWTVEHLVGMLAAIAVITIARTSSKGFADDTKHKRLFIFNLIALAIIVITISIGDRGIFTMGPR
jgi:hypothetical protein